MIHGCLGLASLGLLQIFKQRYDEIDERKDEGIVDRLMAPVEKILRHQYYWNEARIWHIIICAGFFLCSKQKGWFQTVAKLCFYVGYLYVIPKYKIYFNKNKKENKQNDFLGLFATFVGWCILTLYYGLKKE